MVQSRSQSPRYPSPAERETLDKGNEGSGNEIEHGRETHPIKALGQILQIKSVKMLGLMFERSFLTILVPRATFLLASATERRHIVPWRWPKGTRLWGRE